MPAWMGGYKRDDVNPDQGSMGIERIKRYYGKKVKWEGEYMITD